MYVGGESLRVRDAQNVHHFLVSVAAQMLGLLVHNQAALERLPKSGKSCYGSGVSLQEIKSELAEMPQDEQDHLAAYLVHLRHQRDAGLRREITERLNDKEPSHWVSLDQLREHWKD